MRSSLYISNWSLTEPLCQSQSVAYLKGLARHGHQSCLITFERPPYAISPDDIDRAKRELSEVGICWHPLPYHSRSNAVGVVVDAMRACLTGLTAIIRHRPAVVHTRTSVPALLGFVLSRLTRRRFLYDADSELSEEYADAGHWGRTGLKYRALNWAERASRKHADAIVVLTDRMRSDLICRGTSAPIHVIRCCADIQQFRFDERARRRRRTELGLADEKLLVYVGKTGPRYMTDETMAFVRSVRRLVTVRLLVLTHDDAQAFHTAAKHYGIDDSLTVRHVSPDEIPEWLSAADAGLALIRPVRSEQGSSPIKVSEYLAAGLPVVITNGIGDVSSFVESRSLGIVLTHATEREMDDAALRLTRLWSESQIVRFRCAAWAASNLSIESAVITYSEIYDALSVSTPMAAAAISGPKETTR